MATQVVAHHAPSDTRTHRRVRSEPFDFDEPKAFDAILAGLSDSQLWKSSSSPNQTQHNSQEAEVAKLEAYSNPSSPTPSPVNGSDDAAWSYSLSDRQGSGSPDLTNQFGSVTLDEFPTASPRSVEAVWGEIDSWMTEASASEDRLATSTEMPAPAPAPAPTVMPDTPTGIGLGFTLHCWDDEPMDGQESLGMMEAAWDGCAPSAQTLQPIAAAMANTNATTDPAAAEKAETPPGQKRMRLPGGSPRKVKRAGKAAAPKAKVPKTEAAAATATSSSAAPMAEPPALMEKPLPSEIAHRMLTDDGYMPGARPLSFDGLDGRWVFKEDSRDRAPNARNKYDKKADRWHNSGGVRGARDMPTEAPVVRRRYGSVSRAGNILWRFHEYSVVKRVPDAAAAGGVRLEEDRSTVVFHVMPKRAGRGRPSKAEADLPAQLWKEFGFQN